MESSDELTHLPLVEEFTAVSLCPQGLVRFQYRAAEKMCELAMPLDQAFALEELFVKIRTGLGHAIPRRWQNQE